VSAALDALRAEHRVIERALNALELLGPTPNPARLAALVDFFRTYADRWHHGREEDLLFATLAEEVPAPLMESMVDLLEEHEQGRRLVAELADQPAPERRAELITAYCAMLRAHIRREDGVLFVVAETRLAPATLDRLDAQFARYPGHRPPDWAG
jgi:hemerythrin-like domain-containing protein